MKMKILVVALMVEMIVAGSSQGGTLNIVGNVSATNLSAQTITLGGQTLSNWPGPAGTNGAIQFSSNGVFGVDGHLGWDPTLGLEITVDSCCSRDKAIEIYCQRPNSGNDFIAAYNSSGSLRWLFSMLTTDESLRMYSAVTNQNVVDVNQYGMGIFDTADANFTFAVNGTAHVTGNMEVDGKLTTANGSVDPPFLLLDAQTRTAIAQRAAREVAPNKQTGAALFWNSETKRLEVYAASEGAFYDLTGNLLTNITPPTVAGAVVVQTFLVDPETGNVVTNQSVSAPGWHLKPGYQFNRQTGVFTYQATSNGPPVVVTGGQALQLQ